MSTWLGIKFNKWHGIFGALIQVVGISTSGWWISTELLQLQFILAIGVTTLFNSQLQLTNEWLQLTSKKAPDNYRTWKNARANSRDDMKWWILGWIGGNFLGIIILTLIDKLF